MTKKEKEYFTKQVEAIRQRIRSGNCRFGDHRSLKDYEEMLNSK